MILVYPVYIAAFFYLAAKLNSLAILGLYGASKNEDMLLYGFKTWALSTLGVKLSKPLITCVKCMASIWGALPMFIILAVFLPTYIGVLGGLSLALISSIVYACVVSAMAHRMHTVTTLQEAEKREIEYDNLIKQMELQNLQLDMLESESSADNPNGA